MCVRLSSVSFFSDREIYCKISKTLIDWFSDGSRDRSWRTLPLICLHDKNPKKNEKILKNHDIQKKSLPKKNRKIQKMEKKKKIKKIS